MENKYKYWMVTILSDKNKSEQYWLPTTEKVLLVLTDFCERFAYQKEYNENAEDARTVHYQMCLTTKIRLRKSTLLKRLAESLAHDIKRIRVDKMEGTWNQAVEYCSKQETQCGPTVFSPGEGIAYKKEDVAFLLDKDKRFRWQNKILEKIFNEVPYIFKTPDDREIIWITDKSGNSGKSKLVKFLACYQPNCIKISFGTANQIRSAVVNAGKKELYMFDIPRTLGQDDNISSILSVIEDVKNGYVCSSFYGSHNQILFNPPWVIVFSNLECPTSAMSADRWTSYYIVDKDLFSDYPHYLPAVRLEEGR